jgi:hypothetical protein
MTRRIVLAIALAALAYPAAANAWESDTFQSPTSNLVCKYRWNLGSITCGAFSSRKIIHMRRYGRPVEGARISWDDADEFPILGYGETWNAGQPVSCRSLWSGMRCQNATGWFFLIDRSRIYVGRYGQRLYWL